MPVRASNSHRRRSDQGATAITVAISMVVIMGFAAIAIDLGLGFSERRQLQTASDVGAVAGALEFGGGSSDSVANAVISTVNLNVASPYSNSDWTGCVDPDKPAGFTAITHSSIGTIDCISGSASFLRVRLPDTNVATSFGRVIGFDSLTTRAETIVTLNQEGVSGSLPFAIRADASAGEVCLDTSTGSKIVPPCDGNESGSFGNIAPPLFGNETLNTSPSCGNQTSANNYVPESIAMGIDHFIASMSGSAWGAGGLDPDRKQDMSKSNVDPFTNMDECVDTGGAIAEAGDGWPINGVYVDTGNSVKTQITEGTITGTSFADGEDARLTRTSIPKEVDGYQLDDDPLWAHLYDTGDGDDCDRSIYDSLPTIEEKNDAIRRCVENWSSGQIFDDSIMRSPRLGVAPRIWFNVLGSGLSYSPVKSFDVVYIHGIWFNDKDESVFYPGDTTDLSDLDKNKLEIEQMTAFLLHDDMVSGNVISFLGGVTDDTFQPTIYQ